jgi:hypothetical protein
VKPYELMLLFAALVLYGLVLPLQLIAGAA